MRALLVVAHPCSDSFTHACATAAASALERAGHHVDVVDLYASGFCVAMSAAERAAYHGDEPIIDPLVREHAELVRAAHWLVFVYPTWWSGLPAILKGWLERVMVPGTAFEFDHRGKIRSRLSHVQRIIGISTYGSPRPYVAAVNDNGRRILTRALRLTCGVTTRTTWIPFYAIDTASDAQRAEFLTSIEHRLERLS